MITDVKGNNIGEFGARMISESLKTNATLTELNLYGDEIEWNEIMYKIYANNKMIIDMIREQYWRIRSKSDKWIIEN